MKHMKSYDVLAYATFMVYFLVQTVNFVSNNWKHKPNDNSGKTKEIYEGLFSEDIHDVDTDQIRTNNYDILGLNFEKKLLPRIFIAGAMLFNLISLILLNMTVSWVICFDSHMKFKINLYMINLGLVITALACNLAGSISFLVIIFNESTVENDIRPGLNLILQFISFLVQMFCIIFMLFSIRSSRKVYASFGIDVLPEHLYSNPESKRRNKPKFKGIVKKPIYTADPKNNNCGYLSTTSSGAEYNLENEKLGTGNFVNYV